MIAFVRFDGTGQHPVTFITQRSGTHDRGLSLPWLAFWPTWSPDGSEPLVTDFEPGSPIRPASAEPDTSIVLDVPQVRWRRDPSPVGSEEENPLSCQFGNPQRVIQWTQRLESARCIEGGGLVEIRTGEYRNRIPARSRNKLRYRR